MAAGVPSTATGGGQQEYRAGHHWKEADRVTDYIAQNDENFPQMAEVFGILTGVLPFEKTAPIRVLDIGSGHSVLAAAVLATFPAATALGLDISEPMMEIGRQQMAPFGPRFRYHVGDFADGRLPSDLPGPFDLVISSRAIRHITPEAKRSLFGDVYNVLAPGGCFLDIDNMRPRDDFLRARYAQVDPARPRPGNNEQRPRTGGSREHTDPVAEQLASLRDAGFSHVDCFWKRLGRALIGGFKEA
jgi:tRNA (cmo5U34)-methyltransferase